MYGLNGSKAETAGAPTSTAPLKTPATPPPRQGTPRGRIFCLDESAPRGARGNAHVMFSVIGVAEGNGVRDANVIIDEGVSVVG